MANLPDAPFTDRPRRVAIVYDLLYPWTIGGVEKRYWEIARRLPRYGYEAHLFGPKFWEGPASIERESVWLHGVGVPRPVYASDGTRTLTEPLVVARDLLPALLRHRFELIDCCAFPFFPWFSARAVAAIRQIPILTTTPELWGQYWLSYLGPAKGTVARLIERAEIALSRDQLCLSPFTERRLRKASPRTVSISPIPAGIDASALRRLASPSPVREGIVVVSRLIPHKRVADAVEAMALVRATHPSCTLTIVGRGPEESRLRALCGTLGVQDQVRFVSGLDESALYTLIGRSRCLVLASEREGQGLVVAEAQATGTPPVVALAPESAAADFVADGVDGLLYPVGDVARLAAAINRLLDSQPDWERLSSNGYTSAARLDWDSAIVPKVAALYDRLLA